MAKVTAAMVKELRDATGAGMMDCKKALVAADGNMQAAVDAMRKSGAVKAAKKAGRTAAEGVIAISRNGTRAALVEVNSETDFAAKNEEFVRFAQQAADLAAASNLGTAEALRAATLNGQTVGEALTALVAKIGENLQLRRVATVDAGGDVLGQYLHSNRRIGVLAVLRGGDEALGREICMHVCASRPDFVHPEDVDPAVVAHEREIQIELALKSGKPRAIAEKMVEGRMRKFTGEVSLTGQAFIRNPDQTVGQLLAEKHADVVSFVRFEVGEGIAKKEQNFAAEVQAQMAAARK